MWWNQTQRMENFNYWSDHRVIESMVTKTSFLKKNSKTIIDLDWVQEEWEGWAPDEELECSFEEWLKTMNVAHNQEIRCTTTWRPCTQCDGKGTTVNPSYDAGGLPADYFDDDPEEYERYMNGSYDVHCSRCSGSTQEQILNYDDENPLYNWCTDRLNEYLQEQYDQAQEYAFEKKYGC